MPRLFVSNVLFEATEEELTEFFARSGEVTSCKIVTDRDTGRSRGFAFVDVDFNVGGLSEADMIDSLDGQNFNGRAIHVEKAQPKEGGGRNRRDGGGHREGHRDGGKRRSR